MKKVFIFMLSYVSQKNKIAIVSSLRFVSRINFLLSRVEHEKSFITSGPGLMIVGIQLIKNVA